MHAGDWLHSESTRAWKEICGGIACALLNSEICKHPHWHTLSRQLYIIDSTNTSA